MKRALAALGATLAMLTLAEAEELKCEIREKFVCEPGAACKPVASRGVEHHRHGEAHIRAVRHEELRHLRSAVFPERHFHQH